MAANSEQVSHSAGELSKVSEQLQMSVSRFRVSDGNHAMLKCAIGAHAAWNARLKAAIAGGQLDTPVSTIKADDQCQFGKWLYGSSLSAEDRHSQHYHTTRQLHAQFHEEASRIAQLAVSGQREAAAKAMSPSADYARISSSLTDALTRWSAAA
jgi:methyl-accepting chemotaxis protein